MLLVTHDVDEAIVLADRVIVLDDGVVSSDLRIELPAAARRPTPPSPPCAPGCFASSGVEDDRQIGVDGERASPRRAS